MLPAKKPSGNAAAPDASGVRLGGGDSVSRVGDGHPMDSRSRD